MVIFKSLSAFRRAFPTSARIFFSCSQLSSSYRDKKKKKVAIAEGRCLSPERGKEPDQAWLLSCGIRKALTSQVSERI